MNISSFLIGYQAGKQSSGGTSDDVRYVTFMSYDGAVEYGKKAVAVGDDCADPIARGLFSSPTRENTAQYNYTFYGWASVPNGGADANWNKAITEDKTVYANFSAAVRIYTVTYYDGDTVLKTENLAYGTMPEYVPKKTGYDFQGWNPALSNVTGNANYYAQWKEQSGIVEVVTFNRADLPYTRNTLKYLNPAISNSGELVYLPLGNYTNDSKRYPAVYNISGDAPVRLNGPNINDAWSDGAFNYNDTILYADNYNTTDYGHSDAILNVDTTSGLTTVSNYATATAKGRLACSPVSDKYGYDYYSNGTKYEIGSVTITLPAKPNCVEFSSNDAHVAFCGSSYANVYNVDGTLIAGASAFDSTNVTKVSYNSDGSLMAVSYSVAPYVSIYETTNYTKLFDLSSVLTASSYAVFLGTDTLVVGTGTDVLVYTVTATGFKNYELSVPTYDGVEHFGVFKNNSCTSLAIVRTDSILVWAKM